MEENTEDTPEPPPTEPKAEKEETTEEKKSEDEIVVTMPPCKHAWCMGEELRRAGVEPGVCCPKALPWGKPAHLKYLPGWSEQCRLYHCYPIQYGVPSRSNNTNIDFGRRKFEVKETKLLWSYLSPIFKYPKILEYNDSFEKVPCKCALNTCIIREMEGRANDVPASNIQL